MAEPNKNTQGALDCTSQAILKNDAILAGGLILAALVFGLFFYNARSSHRTLEVIGSATKSYQSDIIKWNMTLNRTTGLTNTNAGYVQMEKDLQALKDFLKQAGINESEIAIQPVNTTSLTDRDGKQTGFDLSQDITVITKNVDKVEKLALNPKNLYEKGIVVQRSSINYFFSDLPPIKRELLSLATKDARARGEQIAKTAGVSLGKMSYARTGVFSITEPYSNSDHYYGEYNTSTRKKDVTITMEVGFRLD